MSRATKIVEQVPTGVCADDMRALCEALESFEDTACAFGSLITAEIQVDTEGGHLTAKYDGREWRILVKPIEVVAS